MPDDQNYYSTLGVAKDSDPEEIKQSYRKLAREYHPDRVANLGAEFKELAARKMEAINEAYQVLSDSDKRQEYDKMLESGKTGRPASSASHHPPAATPKQQERREQQQQRERQDSARTNAAEDLMRDQARALMMMESSFFQIRDSVTAEVNLKWEETKSPDFLSILSGKSFTNRYYIFFKSIHTLSPRDFTALLQKLRSLDATTKPGLFGKEMMLVVMFAAMEDARKVEELWKRFNAENAEDKKTGKYVTLVNAGTSKTFAPQIPIKDKHIQAIISKLRFNR